MKRSAFKPKACKQCGSTFHSKSYHKPRNPLKGKRRIRAIGKVGRQWIATRKEWVQKNLPDSGYWVCAYCGKQLYLNTLTLDHKLSRGRHPELRFDLDNLVPACYECNIEKGSLSAEEYMNGTEATKAQLVRNTNKN